MADKLFEENEIFNHARTANLFRDRDGARATRQISIGSDVDIAGFATKHAAAFAAYGLEVTPARTERSATATWPLCATRTRSSG